jgi:hypothetical protein
MAVIHTTFFPIVWRRLLMLSDEDNETSSLQFKVA